MKGLVFDYLVPRIFPNVKFLRFLAVQGNNLFHSFFDVCRDLFRITGQLIFYFDTNKLWDVGLQNMAHLLCFTQHALYGQKYFTTNEIPWNIRDVF